MKENGEGGKGREMETKGKGAGEDEVGEGGCGRVSFIPRVSFIFFTCHTPTMISA